MLLYVHDSIIVSDEKSFDDDTCEAVICTIAAEKTIIANIYRPPDTTSTSFKSLLTFLQLYISNKTENDHHDIIIMGDFNFPNINWKDITIQPKTKDQTLQCEQLLHFMSVNLSSQLVPEPTRKENILDLLLSNNDRIFSQIKTYNTPLSDHSIIKADLLFNPMIRRTQSRPPIFEPSSFRSADLHKTDNESLNRDLCSVDWASLQSLCEDDEKGDGFAELFRLVVLQLTLLHSPSKAVSTTFKPKQARDRYILNRKKRKLKARLNCLKVHAPASDNIQKLEDKLSLLFMDIKDSHEDEKRLQEIKALEKIKSDPKFFFSYAKRFSKLKSNIGPLIDKDGVLQTDPKIMADMLQHQYTSVFSDPNCPLKKSPPAKATTPCSLLDMNYTEEDVSKAIDEMNINAGTSEDDIPARIYKNCKDSLLKPIHMIWSKSFADGKVPSALKIQHINPIHKGGAKTDCAKYRPIALTSHLVKLFERTMRSRIVEFLEANRILSASQHGFRKGRSCLTQLLKHFDNILINLQKGDDSDVIYLDYAKAFDKVDHEILLKKLYSYGIKGKFYDWIKDFLTDRFQTVCVDGHRSFLARVISGVPQGSVLGPILFIIFINDLDDAVLDSILGKFADDTRVQRNISQASDCDILQKDLDNIITWSKHNNMELHEDKFELLSYNTYKTEKNSQRSNLLKAFAELPFNLPPKYQTPNNSIIKAKSLVRDLGVQLSSDYSWTPHINIMVDAARRTTSWVLSVFSDRSPETMMTLYKSLIRSRLEYCCPLWNPHLIRDIQQIESVQRTFTSKIQGCRHLDYHERLKHLGLFSLQRRRERYIIIHMWKVLHDLSPNDLDITFGESGRLGIKAKLPALPRQCKTSAKSLYDSSFAVMGPRLWNAIPENVKCHQTMEGFKNELNMFLRKRVKDLPPTVGYVTPHSNSICDWSPTSQVAC